MSRRRTLNAAARREQARLEAERLQKQQVRRRWLIVAVSVGVLVLVAVAGLIIWRGSQQTYLQGVERTPEGADLTGGIPVAADGTAGSAADAPRLDVYLDLQSPESVAFWQTQGPDLQTLSSDGTIALWIHLVGFVDGGVTGASTRAGEAAVVVAHDAPEQFLPFLAGEFGLRIDGAEQLNDADLDALALEVGVSQEVADRFTDNLFDEWFIAATAQAQRDDIATTPTLLLEGESLDGDWTAAGALTSAVTVALAG